MLRFRILKHVDVTFPDRLSRITNAPASLISSSGVGPCLDPSSVSAVCASRAMLVPNSSPHMQKNTGFSLPSPLGFGHGSLLFAPSPHRRATAGVASAHICLLDCLVARVHGHVSCPFFPPPRRACSVPSLCRIRRAITWTSRRINCFIPCSTVGPSSRGST